VPPSVPVILGPTASGKTSVGILLARALDAEVISVDSRKVYRGLPIGTATPNGVWRQGAYVVEGIPHHLIAHLSPDMPYTAGDFARDAEHLIGEIRGRGRTPLLVGGTGFYFKALQQGLPPLPPRDPQIREELEARMTAEGGIALHAELAARDPEAGEHIDPSDRHKVIRALEVIRLTGRPFSAALKNPPPASQHKFVVMGIDFPKPLLDRRIEERAERMFEGGMIEETARLLDQGYSPYCPALASFGYREAVQVVRQKMPREAFLPALIRGTKLYARRQRTWFRTQTRPSWFMCGPDSKKEEISMRMKAFFEGASA
jgi:tRNA dimethylallyltransferase